MEGKTLLVKSQNKITYNIVNNYVINTHANNTKTMNNYTEKVIMTI